MALQDKLQEAKKIQEQKELSTGEQLNIISEVKRMDYQNSLVMKSLEEYNKKFEILRTEQVEQLKAQKNEISELKQTVENMNQANQLLSQSIETEVGKWKDSSIEQMNILIRKLQESLNSRLGTVADDTKKYIRELESIKSDSKDRFDSYYNRKKWLDYLVIANLSIVPILLIILSYVVFFKK